MSCKECDKIQELNKKDEKLAYLRIGIGNVLIGACDKHFNEIRKKIGIKTSQGIARVDKLE